MLELIDQQHLGGVFAGQPIGRVPIEPVHRARGGQIAQPLQHGPHKGGHTIGFINELQGLGQRQTVGRDTLPQRSHLARGRLEAAHPRQGSCSPGTPPLPGIVTRKRLALPSSRVTPLMTCPALRPQWCLGSSPLMHPGLQPSGACKPSAFPALLMRVSSRTTTIPISGLYHAACHLAPPSSAPPLLAEHVGFATDWLAGR
jgi:hypothetical protein